MFVRTRYTSQEKRMGLWPIGCCGGADFRTRSLVSDWIENVSLGDDPDTALAELRPAMVNHPWRLSFLSQATGRQPEAYV
jgi:hypothetical protein